MTDVLAGVLMIAVMFTALSVLIPLGLCYLLWRQVSRSRAGRMLLGRRSTPRRGGVVAMQPGLRRQWAQLASDAAAAGARFAEAADALPKGPLRGALDDARREVDEAVVEAQRLAVQGDRTERAYRDTVRALDSQRRRRRGPAGPADVEDALAAATRAQHESAERLAASTRAQLCQLQLVVARLHGLTAHAHELAALQCTPELTTSATTLDRLAALRAATAEIDALTAV